MRSPGSILVYAPSWIGDAVLSLAALRSLKAAFPGSRISLLARPWVEELYAGCEAADEIILYDRNGADRGPRGFFRAARSLRERRFDLALLFPNAFRAAALVWAARIPERWGYATDGRGFLLTRPIAPAPRPFGRHQVHYYLDLLRALSLPTGPPDTHLTLTEAMKARAEAILREHGCQPGQPLVGLNPGATYGSAKRWLPERYAAVGDRLANSQGARLVVIGGPAEKALAERVSAHSRTAPILLAGKTSLGELMGLLGSLSLFITNDSGPMHVAAALGIPTVAIFGPTDERETGPLGRSARVLRQNVECSPCLLRECPIDHRCMTRVEVEEVYRVAVELQDRASSRRTAGVGFP